MTDHDRGLGAVERVRGVRERDSLIGLQHAQTIEADREADAERARQRLATLAAFTVGTPRAFAADRLVSLAAAADRKRRQDDADAARSVAEQAREHWRRDRTQLRSVELLLERRRDERAAERDRLEARELDEIAVRAWVRRAALQQRRASDAGR